MTLITSYESMTLRAPTVAARFPLQWLAELDGDLREFFGCPFALWDGDSGTLIRAATDVPPGDPLYISEMVRVVARGQKSQFIGEEDGVLLLGIPFELRVEMNQLRRCVAVAPFALRRLSLEGDVQGPARLLGLDRPATLAWFLRQELWTSTSLSRLALAVQAKRQADSEVLEAKKDVETIADNLATTYEEITLIYGVTQNLRISSTDEDTGRFALQNLVASLPIAGAAIQLLPVAERGKATYKARLESMLLTEGDELFTNEQFSNLVEHLGLEPGMGPYVANHTVTEQPDWPLPQVKQIIIVPLSEGKNLFGWLAAVNHKNHREFNTVEASLLGTVGVMLGIHSGNRELYRRQAELLASVVRALTSAIDAKDPYTCGHSDRVARIAVRLAKELGKDPEFLNTIYMAGLLHDIGKIGIDERVLRKPDKLTPEEYEHIKLHPELGFRILADIQQLREVLPAVLHHHEQWDGKGYPHQLAAENIPEIARIMSVADAYDAMFSSRPYRPGMPEEKVEAILRKGAGAQWDAHVVSAYFRARDDIRQIGENERANLTLDVEQWG